MNSMKKILFAGLMASTAFVFVGNAEANRTGSTRAAPAQRATGAQRGQQRTTRPRATQPARTTARLQRRTSSTNPMKDPKHLAKVKALKSKWTDIVKHGEISGGNAYFYAAQAELVSAGGISQKQTVSLSYGEGKDRSQRLKITGVKNGVWEGHLVGTVSTHDLSSLSDAQYTKAVNDRIKSDRVQISYDFGPNTPRKVLASGIKSEAATVVPLKVPLNKNGITRVIYDRTNASGNVVGSSSAYVGRVVELTWDGK